MFKIGGADLWEFNLRDIFRWCELMTKHQVRKQYIAYIRTYVNTVTGNMESNVSTTFCENCLSEH